MKNISNYLLFSVLPLFILARGCADNADETYDEDIMEVNYTPNDKVTKEMAIENWELFLKQSQVAMEISETNIGSLQPRIDNAKELEKDEFQKLSNSSNLKLLKLKTSRIKRNKDFTIELDDYDSNKIEIQQRNELFKKDFKNELLNLNDTIENLLEKTK